MQIRRKKKKKMQFLLPLEKVPPPIPLFRVLIPQWHKLNAIEINFACQEIGQTLTRHMQQVCSNCINLLATSSETE